MITLQIQRWQLSLFVGFILCTLAGTFLFVQSGAVSGQSNTPLYSISAMACTPNGASARAGLADASHGNARKVDGRSGTLYLICPVTDTRLQGVTVSTLTVTKTGGGFTVALRASDRSNDNVRNVLSYNADDVCLGNSVERFFNCSGTGSHRMDFTQNYYYIQISVNSSNARIYGVTLS